MDKNVSGNLIKRGFIAIIVLMLVAGVVGSLSSINVWARGGRNNNTDSAHCGRQERLAQRQNNQEYCNRSEGGEGNRYMVRQCNRHEIRQCPRYESGQCPRYESGQCPRYGSGQCPRYESRQCPHYGSRQCPHFVNRQCPRDRGNHREQCRDCNEINCPHHPQEDGSNCIRRRARRGNCNGNRHSHGHRHVKM